MESTSAIRVVLRLIAGPSPPPSDLRELLFKGLNGRHVTLGQRINLTCSLFEIADVLPLTRALFDMENTSVVILRGEQPLLPQETADRSSDTALNSTRSLRIVYNSSRDVSPVLVVSPSVRAIIDTVSRSDIVLFCGVRVAIAVQADVLDPFTSNVACLTTFLSLANASRFAQFRIDSTQLTDELHFASTDKGIDMHTIVSSLFAPLPPASDSTRIMAIKVAPIAPYGYRRYVLSEEMLWKGLRARLSTMRGRAAEESACGWLCEGQIISVSKSQTVELQMASGILKEEEVLERLAIDIRKSSSKAHSTGAFDTYDQHKETPTCEQIAFVEVVSVITCGGSSLSTADVCDQSGGGYLSADTRLEVGDVSEVDTIVQIPYLEDSTCRILKGLTSTNRIARGVQQCIDFQVHHDDTHADLEGVSATTRPRLQVLVVHGDESNFVFETVKTAVSGILRLPYHTHDCRSVSEKPKASGEVFDFGICEMIEEGVKGAISRPLVLIVRHAQLLEGNASARHAVAQRLERCNGYLIVIFCHERAEGGGGGKAAATNTSSEGNSASSAGGSVRLSSHFSSFIVSTINCPVPNESDRVAILSSLFPPKEDSTLEKSPYCSWVRSITLSPSLIASWTVGFSLMDIVAYVGTVVRRAHSRYRTALASDREIRMVLSDEDFLQGLADYQHSHGLIVSSTKLQPVRWSDVGGLHEAKKEILETIQLPTKFPHLFKAGGMQRKMGILLFGPPGCGKTLLAKAVATEMNMNFLSVKGPELINQYVGESEKNVRDIFQRARDNAPCVLFFDELDALAPARGAKGDAGGAMDRIVSQLLVEMDGVDKGGGDVFIVAATNRPDMLDAALLRPGRFDQRCYLGPPDGVEEKALALKALTRKFALAADVDLMAIATRLQDSGRFTGADLFALCSDAMLFAVEERVGLLKAAASRALSDESGSVDGEEDEMKVEMIHFEKALSQLKPSVTAEEFEKYERLRSNMDK